MLEIRGIVIGGTSTPIFSLSTHLPNIDSARQRCSADKTQGKSHLWLCTGLISKNFNEGGSRCNFIK